MTRSGAPAPRAPQSLGGLPTLTELGQLKTANTQLRRDLEQCRKDTAALKTTHEATLNQLRQSELARAACDEYARRLEQRLEKSGKGVALLKAARLQSDLEFLEKENEVLFSDVKNKEQEIQRLQDELHRQHGLVEQASHQLGLPSRQVLEELYDLRQQVAQMVESLGDKDEQIKSQAAQLQDGEVYRNDYKRLKDRCDEAERSLQQAEGDKASLLDYIEDLRRHKEQDQAKVDELLAAKQELRKQVTGLDAKRAELEQLLKEQQEVLQGSKQQCDVVEVQLEKQKRSNVELSQQRSQLSEQLQALQRQQSVLEVELVGMQEHMRGVLDLSRNQQVELNARVDALTHRITAALATAATQAGGNGGKGAGAAGGGASLPGQPQGVITAVSRVSRQQEALIEQHLQLKQELRLVADVREQNQLLSAKVAGLEAEQRRLLEERGVLEARVAEQVFAWSLLEAAVPVRPGSQAPALSGPGKETELVKHIQSEVAQARSSAEVLQHRCLEQAREAEQLQRTINSLRESLETTRAAMSELPPPEDLAEAIAQSSQLEALKERLEQRLKTQAQLAAEQREADAQQLRATEERVADLQAKLAAARAEQQQLQDLVERARTMQEQAMRDAASAHEAIRLREEELLQLRAKLAAVPSYRPEHVQQREAAQAEEVARLTEQVAEGRQKLVEAREEQQGLREQLERARALHADSLREGREAQHQLQQLLQEARVQHAESLRVAKAGAREEVHELQGQVQGARAQQAKTVLEAEAERRQLEELLQETRVQHGKVVQAAEEERRRLQDALHEAQGQHAAVVQGLAEGQRRLEDRLREARAEGARMGQEAEEERQQLQEELRALRALEEVAVREASASKQVVQQQDQEILQLRAKLSLRRPSRPHPEQAEASTSQAQGQEQGLQSRHRAGSGRVALQQHQLHVTAEIGAGQVVWRDTAGSGWEGRAGAWQGHLTDSQGLATPHPDQSTGPGVAKRLVLESGVLESAYRREDRGARDTSPLMVPRWQDQGARSIRPGGGAQRRDRVGKWQQPLVVMPASSSEEEEDGIYARRGRAAARSAQRPEPMASVAKSGALGHQHAVGLLQSPGALEASRATTAKLVQAQLAALGSSYRQLRGSRG